MRLFSFGTPSTPATTRDDDLALLRLIRSRRVGPATFHRLMAEHGSAAAALQALPSVARAAGMEDYAPCPEGVARAELAAGRRLGARLLRFDAADYPAALRELPDAPPLLWVRGEVAALHRPMVAVIGARSASSLGLRMAAGMAGALAGAGVTVVAGLARGIDTAAHEASLAGGTVAVLAGGLDRIYPAENAALAEAITACGCLVSEQAFGTEPAARLFPLRNRIVSGLARAVVVVEAAHRSGTLITAACALDQGREVMAVPGHPMDARAAGCNALIRDGATLVRSAADVLAVLEMGERGDAGSPDPAPLPLSPSASAGCGPAVAAGRQHRAAPGPAEPPGDRAKADRSAGAASARGGGGDRRVPAQAGAAAGLYGAACAPAAAAGEAPAAASGVVAFAARSRPEPAAPPPTAPTAIPNPVDGRSGRQRVTDTLARPGALGRQGPDRGHARGFVAVRASAPRSCAVLPDAGAGPGGLPGEVAQTGGTARPLANPSTASPTTLPRVRTATPASAPTEAAVPAIAAPAAPARALGPTSVEARILGLLSPSPTDENMLSRDLDLPSSACSAALLMLELSGAVIRLPGGKVALSV